MITLHRVTYYVDRVLINFQCDMNEKESLERYLLREFGGEIIVKESKNYESGFFVLIKRSDYRERIAITKKIQKYLSGRFTSPILTTSIFRGAAPISESQPFNKVARLIEQNIRNIFEENGYVVDKTKLRIFTTRNAVQLTSKYKILEGISFRVEQNVDNTPLLYTNIIFAIEDEGRLLYGREVEKVLEKLNTQERRKWKKATSPRACLQTTNIER